MAGTTADAVLKKVDARDAAEVCRHLKLSDEAATLPSDGQSPRAYLDSLIAAGCLTDAEAFLAHALPKREAVWWACLCTREVAGPSPALEAAEAWVIDPTDANRRKALAEAEAIGLKDPAGSSAFAAFMSGDSLAPAGVPAVPPAPYLAARSVAGALKLAAVLIRPELAPQKHRTFLDLGLGVAEGRLVWDK